MKIPSNLAIYKGHGNRSPSHQIRLDDTERSDPLGNFGQYAFLVLLAWIALGVYFWVGYRAWQEVFDALDSPLWLRHFFGQFNHTNGAHLTLNLIAMGVVQWGLGRSGSVSNDCGKDCKQGSWPSAVVCLALSLCFVPIYLSFVEPMSSYVGLSGALHGWFAYLLLVGFVQDRKLPLSQSWPVWLLVIGFFAKLLLEWVNGNEYSELIGASVATQAHRAGAVFGLIFFCIVVLTRPKQTHQLIEMN